MKHNKIILYVNCQSIRVLVLKKFTGWKSHSIKAKSTINTSPNQQINKRDKESSQELTNKSQKQNQQIINNEPLNDNLTKA